ncbi:MAG: periplasmic heavy metal sensor [Pseudolabrys sp.]|nr:periplasmic heavy metal sensor [Pseudolabrys sp.]MDP2296414.1 periplasmic heavy metal sensor [Pseudolabrys sp.]
MSVAQLASTKMTRGSSRWLLLGSLALNLFFIGAAIALAVRPPAPAPAWDRDVFVRVERIAGTLPAADAAILRAQIQANRGGIESTQEKYRSAQGTIREALRTEPFDAEALRAAMGNARTARQTFDQTIQGVFAGSAAQMTQGGRQALADWPPGRKSAGAKP